MNDLTLEQITKELERLEALPPYLDQKFTVEEAKEYLSPAFIKERGLTEDKDLIFHAESQASCLYPADRNFLIMAYRILKSNKEAELKSEVARERLELYGVWLPNRVVE
jgi:hypothetical protein